MEIYYFRNTIKLIGLRGMSRLVRLGLTLHERCYNGFKEDGNVAASVFKLIFMPKRVPTNVVNEDKLRFNEKKFTYCYKVSSIAPANCSLTFTWESTLRCDQRTFPNIRIYDG